MNWYTFKTRKDFDLWHKAVKEKLGYPLPGIDQNGNILGEPYTTDYTSVVKVAENDWRTISAEEHAEGLETSSNPNESNYA
jgi:hypothetical protein